MVFAITLVGVFVTHQIAGPALFLTRCLNELAAGRLPRLRPLRKNDELTDLFAALHATVDRVGRETRADIVLLERTKGALDAKQHMALVSDLDRLLIRLRGQLPSDGAETDAESTVDRTDATR
jgi:nitrogen fixation/metabolism regulation signal transduction histidine kinase